LQAAKPGEDKSVFESLLANAHYQKLEEKRLNTLFRGRFRHKRVLDLGCGHGKYLRLLRELGCPATGVDVNPDQVADLDRQGYRVFLPEDLPGNERYDVILMAHIIEHLAPEALRDFMDRHLSLLEEDGRLIILTPLPGARFYHDCTHIRPYTPQSVWMLFGGLNTPAAWRARDSFMLEDIYFFRDGWRLREQRSYYPVPGARAAKNAVLAANVFLAALHALSRGRLGAAASWLGVYRRAGERA
jgi:SAM-dependent methyltransferase